MDRCAVLPTLNFSRVDRLEVPPSEVAAVVGTASGMSPSEPSAIAYSNVIWVINIEFANKSA